MLGLDELLEVHNKSTRVLAPHNAMAGSTPGGGGGDADDLFDQLLSSLPNFEANRRLQKTLLSKHQARQQAEQAWASAAEQVQQEAAEHAEEEAAAQTAAAKIQELREELTLGVNLEELREHEACLVALPPPQEPAAVELDGWYLQAVQAAQSQLGLDLVLEAAATDDEEQQLLQEMFRAGLRSGFVRSMVLQRGEAGQELVQALLSTMAASPDAETAGAAFVALMALMGCTPSGSSGSGSGRSIGGSSEAAGGSPPGSAEPAAAAGAERAPQDCLMLDAHHGLPQGQTLAPAAASSGEAGAGAMAIDNSGSSSKSGGLPPACRLACIPTDAQLLEALKANGYQPGSGSSGGRLKSGGRQAGTTGSTAAAAAAAAVQTGEQGEAGGRGEALEECVVVRLQAIKLILRTAQAVCIYCEQHPFAPKAAAALSREGLAELLLACFRMCLDPASNQLDQDLEAATVALLGAFAAQDWDRKLPQLAERLADMGPSNAARLKLFKKVPTVHPRGLALQQFAAALLLERLLPPSKQGGKSAVSRRGGGSPDPAAVISAQPWFGDAKGLIAGATSGVGKAPKGGYTIGVVELVLKVCHLLLWPHALAYGQDQPRCLTADFLEAWLRFLVACQKHIRNMQPEDQAVKVLAAYLELEYRNVAEASMPLSP